MARAEQCYLDVTDRETCEGLSGSLSVKTRLVARDMQQESNPAAEFEGVSLKFELSQFRD